MKDGSPDWMRDNVIFPAHDDKMPDDTTYRFIEMAVDAIADCENEDEIEERIFEIEPDIYTSDLTAWLNERNDHVYYLTEALEEMDIKDGFALLSAAQAIQIREVAFSVLGSLQGLCD